MPHDLKTVRDVNGKLRQNRHMWWPVLLPWTMGTHAAPRRGKGK